MAVVFELTSRNFQAGEREFGPANIPEGVTVIRATFTRENWPLTNQDVVLRCGIECSLDGGTTWPIGGYNYNRATSEGGWVGGTRIKRDGNAATFELVQLSPIPELTNPNRRVRAFTEVVSTLRSAVTLEVF